MAQSLPHARTVLKKLKTQIVSRYLRNLRAVWLDPDSTTMCEHVRGHATQDRPFRETDGQGGLSSKHQRFDGKCPSVGQEQSQKELERRKTRRLAASPLGLGDENKLGGRYRDLIRARR